MRSLHGDTPILMADGRVKALRAIETGESVIGTERRGSYRHYVGTPVLATGSEVGRAHRVTLADGTRLIVGADHRLLTERGWKHVTGAMSGPGRRPYLTRGNKLMGTCRFADPPKDTVDRRRGYLAGLVRGDGAGTVDESASARLSSYLTGELALSLPITWPSEPSDEWRTGLLAGVFDSLGGYSRRIIRLGGLTGALLAEVMESLRRFGFTAVVEYRRSPTGYGCVRVDGGLAEHLRFFHTVDPACDGKRSIVDAAIKSAVPLGVLAVDDLEVDLPLYGLATGTGDLVADGVVGSGAR